MAEGKIIRLGGGSPVVIDGEEVVSGEYTETINKFDAVALTQSDIMPTKLPNPAALPAQVAFDNVFSPNGLYLAVAHFGGSLITIYKRDGDTFTKLDNPASLPSGNTALGVSFSPDNLYLAVAIESSPFITIYKRSGDTFTKLADPAVLPPNTGRGISFSQDGNYVALAHTQSPFLTIYKRSGDTFTKLANPNALPASTGNHVHFGFNGIYLAVAHNESPFITIYKRDGDTFTKLDNPAVLPTGTGQGTRFSNNGTYLAVAHTNSPFVTVYKRDNDVFTQLANPDILPSFTGRAVDFNSNDKYMAVAHNSSPCVSIYRNVDDFFVKIPNVDVQPTIDSPSISFSPDDIYLAAGANQFPFILIYKNEVEQGIVKTNNITNPVDTVNLGYALEDGVAGETKTMMSLFKIPQTAVPTSVSLTTAPTGFQSSPPPVYLRVGFTNPTNQTVDVEALLFRADTPGTLLGVNNLPTTLAPNATFGPSDVDTAPGNSGLHILTVRIKEPGKAFSDIVEVSVNLVSEGGGGGVFI